MLNGRKIAALFIARANDERHMEFIGYLNDALVKNGYQLVIYHTCTDFYHFSSIERGEVSVIQLMDFSVIDTVIIFDEAFHNKDVPRSVADLAKEHGTPVITVGAQYDGCISFVFDYAKGFENIIRHVVEHHGAKDICMIAGIKGEHTSEERIGVFHRVMAEYGLPAGEDRLFYGDYWWGPAKAAAEQIIASGKIPDAIVCANDMMAITVCETFRKSGFSVPKDIIITGFDGTKEAANCTPPLTTSRCDLKKTVDEIIDIIKTPDISASIGRTLSVPYCLDTNNSCGCARNELSDDLGDMLKLAQDVLRKYQDDHRALYQLTEDIMLCETPEAFVERLSSYSFYCISIILNNDCFSDHIDPIQTERETPFDDVMQTLYMPFKDNSRFPEPIERRNIMPDIEDALSSGMPLVINPLSVMGKPIGYMCFFLAVSADLYCLIPQFVTAMNNAVNSFRTVRYLRYVADNMKNISRRDYMTGMYNRTGFYDEMPRLVESCTQNERILVATIDIDGLKRINDEFGHENGDFAINSVCGAVKELPFERKVCGRFGGDELVVCALSEEANGAERMKAALSESLAAVNAVSGKPFTVSASIGVCTVEIGDFDFDAALKESDEAMYIMKIGRPNRRRS